MTTNEKHFDLPVEVRFRDLDAYGHVNNASYFTIIETARVKFLQRFYPQGLESGPLFLVARASCDFKRPLGLTDGVTVRLWASRFGRSSFYLTYEIVSKDGTVHAQAETRMVCVDRTSHRPTAVPGDFRSLLTNAE
ncbi:MAG: acyl-CoA thioesterase [Alkalispirochaetaceae bacterium]